MNNNTQTIDPAVIRSLEDHARQIRLDLASMFYRAGTGHFGGCLSAADLIAALYFRIMRVYPDDPKNPDRDRLVISKGHAAPSAYSAMCTLGFFPRSYIDNYETLCANLNTHPNMLKIPGWDMSSGSLGHGLPVAMGMAIAGKYDKKDYRVYCIIGDGESGEGSIWETALSAPKFKLDNLIAFTDRNHLCVDGTTEEVLPLEPLREKWQDFGWEVFEMDGHDMTDIVSTIETAKASRNAKPKMIITHTIKGKGISFMENVRSWHGGTITEEQYRQILKELEG